MFLTASIFNTFSGGPLCLCKSKIQGFLFSGNGLVTAVVVQNTWSSIQPASAASIRSASVSSLGSHPAPALKVRMFSKH